MERIMLGYDGRPPARAALEWVAERARHVPGWVELVTVTNMLLPSRVSARGMLDAAATDLRASAPDLDVETRVFDGVMPGTLLEAARGADLLVVGVDRDHPVREALHGWRPLRVGVRSEVPTVLVPTGWTYRSGPISVGVDRDDSSMDAVTFAATEADRADEPLRLVHSWSYQVPTADTETTRVAARQHHDRLDREAARARGLHRELRVESEIAHSNPVSALVSAARDSSLLVIGTHHRGILAGGLLGSTAQDLVGAVEVPICVVPPRAAGEASRADSFTSDVSV